MSIFNLMVANFGQKRVQVFRQNFTKKPPRISLHAFLQKKVNFPLLSFSTHFYLFLSQTSSSDGFPRISPISQKNNTHFCGEMRGSKSLLKLETKETEKCVEEYTSLFSDVFWEKCVDKVTEKCVDRKSG